MSARESHHGCRPSGRGTSASRASACLRLLEQAAPTARSVGISSTGKTAVPLDCWLLSGLQGVSVDCGTRTVGGGAYPGHHRDNVTWGTRRVRDARGDRHPVTGDVR